MGLADEIRLADNVAELQEQLAAEREARQRESAELASAKADLEVSAPLMQDFDELRAERDAAIARVAELEAIAREYVASTDSTIADALARAVEAEEELGHQRKLVMHWVDDAHNLAHERDAAIARAERAEAALADKTEGWKAPFAVEKADENCGIYLWSDGHRHYYVPKSSTDALSAEAARLREALEKIEAGPDTMAAAIAQDVLRGMVLVESAALAETEKPHGR